MPGNSLPTPDTLPTTLGAPTDAGQPLNAHLDELRYRLLISLGAIMLATIGGFYVAKPLIGWLVNQTPQLGNQTLSLAQLSPGDTLFSAVKIAFIVGIMAASPVWLFHTLRFILPGLVGKEKLALMAVCITGSGLFLFGLWFGATLVLPTTLEFLVGYGADIVTTQLAIGHYVGFCTSLLLLLGLAFELPLVIWGLAALGVLKSGHLISKWRETILGIFVLAAVLTPSQDPASLMLVGGMLAALVGLSVIPMVLLGR